MIAVELSRPVIAAGITWKLLRRGDWIWRGWVRQSVRLQTPCPRQNLVDVQLRLRYSPIYIAMGKEPPLVASPGAVSFCVKAAWHAVRPEV